MVHLECEAQGPHQIFRAIGDPTPHIGASIGESGPQLLSAERLLFLAAPAALPRISGGGLLWAPRTQQGYMGLPAARVEEYSLI